ncbi:hypothetical protein GTO89_04005 [Heliobacterium gestii]|uniref:SLH domain-containing protein n=1 Tax=Heliomicrobium gestii TaxID=2699 RepID=A0A845L6F2_HELGE|nr:S-layer homology domain-containing protein [Heliomicrobium gestii]MBM7866773.1 hypothetical protein [Heliomicrobium gestii]MZP42202.1 hypothetical protein [Heliomicrobium gestii]
MNPFHRWSLKRWLIAPVTLAITLSTTLNPLTALAADGGKSFTPQPTTPPALFSDVSGGDPGYVFINYSVKRGMLAGYPDGSFHPDEGLTRAQAAFLMAKRMNLPLDGAGQSPFPDVPSDHWAQSAIAASSKAGVLRGFEDGTFRPDEPLTRIQSVVLLLRLEKSALPAVKRSFTDIPEDYWAKDQAAVAAEAGLVDLPKESNAFSPDRTFNRRELARALSMLYTLAPSLRSTDLPIKLVAKDGTTTVTTGSASTQVKGERAVTPGDSIYVESGTAELLFDDGTGMLLKKGTRMTVKEAKGRAYIKNQGLPGVSVDWLHVNMSDGEAVGVLATNRILRKTTSAGINTMFGQTSPLLAAASDAVLSEALSKLRLAEEDQGAKDDEWWKVAAEEKTHIQMDMAWGVAAVQGTRFAARGNSGGTGSFSVIDGRGSIAAAGQSFAVPPGLETTVAAPGQPPAPPAPLSPAAIASFVAAQSFLTQQAAAAVQNQPAPVAVPPALQAQLAPTIAPTPVPPAVPPAIQSLYRSINQVEVSAAASVSSNTPATNAPAAPAATTTTTPSHSSGGGSSNRYITDLTAVGEDGKVRLTFTAPAGATTVLVQQSTDGGATWSPAAVTETLSASSTSASVIGVTNGQSYKFQLIVTGGTYAGTSNMAMATPQVTQGVTYNITTSAAQNPVTIQGLLKNSGDVQPNVDVTLRVTKIADGAVQNVLFDQTVTDNQGSFAFIEYLPIGKSPIEYTIYVGGLGTPQSVKITMPTGD